MDVYTQEGIDAYWSCKALADNPYPSGSREAQEWSWAYEYARMEFFYRDSLDLDLEDME